MTIAIENISPKYSGQKNASLKKNGTPKSLSSRFNNTEKIKKICIKYNGKNFASVHIHTENTRNVYIQANRPIALLSDAPFPPVV